MITVNSRLRVMLLSEKIAWYAVVSNSTGQKLTSPRRMADLELRETAATFTKGSRHVRLKIMIIMVRTICAGVQIRDFLTVISCWSGVMILSHSPPYQIPSSPRRLATILAPVIRISPTTDWNRPTAVALANCEFVIPARYTKVESTSQ